MKTFKIAHSESTKASKQMIWKLWSDINNWPQWDVGLATCKASCEFKVGNTFELTPRGAPDAVVATLTEVVPNVSFSDKTELGFASIEAIHKMREEVEGLIITHTIIVCVRDDKADFFEGKMLPGFKNGLPQSVKSLVAMAEKLETTCA